MNNINEQEFSKQRRNICVVAGESSGDLQGALLVSALKKEFEKISLAVDFWGSAGASLLKENVEAVISVKDIAVMGFAEIFSSYFTISSSYKKLLHEIELRKPLAVIFIDYPGFNLRLIQDVHMRGFTTIYHIPPKVWAHGQGRVRILAKYAYLVTSILPFEESFFKSNGVNLKFIGNPLLDNVENFIKKYGNKKDPYKIGILPGSRKREIKMLLPILVESFVKLSELEKNIRAEIPVADTLSVEFVQDVIDHTLNKINVTKSWWQERVKLLPGDAYHTLSTSYYAWVCSGTAALETAFFITPMSVFYKVAFLTDIAAKIFLKVKFISLVNLCADKLVVPEFIRQDLNVENLVNHAKCVMKDGAARSEMLNNLNELKSIFPIGVAENAAREIIDCVLKYDVDLAKKFHMQVNQTNES